MKILGLSCSPRKMGNTEILVTEALDGARNEGAEAELFSVSGREIRPCDGCYACRETGRCHIHDDMQTVYEKMMDADGIIFGTPVYFYNMTSQAKAIMDRTIAIRRPDIKLANKVGGVIVVAGRLGLIDAIKDLYFYIAINHMVAADYVAGMAGERGAIREDERAMKSAWELGREMLQLGGKGFEFPGEFEGGLTSYVTAKYRL